jgi:hypothetical protein
VLGCITVVGFAFGTGDTYDPVRSQPGLLAPTYNPSLTPSDVPPSDAPPSDALPSDAPRATGVRARTPHTLSRQAPPRLGSSTQSMEGAVDAAGAAIDAAAMALDVAQAALASLTHASTQPDPDRFCFGSGWDGPQPINDGAGGPISRPVCAERGGLPKPVPLRSPRLRDEGVVRRGRREGQVPSDAASGRRAVPMRRQGGVAVGLESELQGARERLHELQKQLQSVQAKGRGGPTARIRQGGGDPMVA